VLEGGIEQAENPTTIGGTRLETKPRPAGTSLIALADFEHSLSFESEEEVVRQRLQKGGGHGGM